jgi:hypothetical protein
MLLFSSRNTLAASGGIDIDSWCVFFGFLFLAFPTNWVDVLSSKRWVLH